MKQKIILLLILFATYFAHAQVFSESNMPTDIVKKVDNYLVEKYKLKGDYIAIIYNGRDCEKCSYSLYTFLDTEKTKQNKKINVFTDNIALAKKALEDYHDYKITFALEKKVMEIDPEIFARTFYYIKNYTEHNNTTTKNILIEKDSVFTSDNIEVTRIPYNKLLIYDNRIEKACIVTENVYNQKPEYKDYPVKDSLKLYNLPERVVNKQLEKVSIKQYEALRKKFKYKFLRIRSFSYSESDSKVYCNFCLERIYKDKNNPEAPTSLITNCFIADLKINSEKDLEKIFQIENYDHFYLADLIMKDNEMYPLSTFIYDQLDFTAPKTFNLKIKKFTPEMNDMEFQGLAKIKIENDKLNIISIDKNVDTYNRNNAILKFNNVPYLLLKIYSDEAANIGKIEFQKLIEENHTN